jgi:hypothetical protein
MANESAAALGFSLNRWPLAEYLSKPRTSAEDEADHGAIISKFFRPSTQVSAFTSGSGCVDASISNRSPIRSAPLSGRVLLESSAVKATSGFVSPGRPFLGRALGRGEFPAPKG